MEDSSGAQLCSTQCAVHGAPIRRSIGFAWMSILSRRKKKATG